MENNKLKIILLWSWMILIGAGIILTILMLGDVILVHDAVKAVVGGITLLAGLGMICRATMVH